MLYIGKKWNSVNFRYGFAHYLKCSPVWETIFGPTIRKAYINIHLQLISVSHKAFWNFFSWVSSLSFICVTFQRHLQILCHASVECPLRFLCNCDGWPSVSPSSVTLSPFRCCVTFHWSVPWGSWLQWSTGGPTNCLPHRGAPDCSAHTKNRPYFTPEHKWYMAREIKNPHLATMSLC